MKTKLLVEICNLEQGQKFIEENVDALILNVMGVTYTKQFNCYTNELSILAQRAQENNIELFFLIVACNGTRNVTSNSTLVIVRYINISREIVFNLRQDSNPELLFFLD